MKRGFVLAAAAVALGSQGCDRRFEFDTTQAGAGGGMSQSGSATVSNGGVSGVSGVSSGGSNAGGGAAGERAGMPCGSLSTCSLGLHCADDQCVQCAEDEDCAAYSLPRCEPTRHRCVACVTTADCADGFACDSLASRCLQICDGDGDCPKNAHGCDERRQVCYQCDEDRECETSPLGYLCASDGSGCVQCRKEADCPGQHCDQLSGRCVDCRDGLDCASGLCSPATFSCAEL